MIKRIAIFGDSWPHTSFIKLPNFQEKPDTITFESLFADQSVLVENFSKPGGTNLDTLEKVKMHSNYDLLIVFQTDPIRQCVDNSGEFVKVKENLTLPNASNFIELCEFLLRDFYLELAKINSPILLIGGSTRLCFEHVPKSINTLPMSWTELMTEDFKDSYFYWFEPTICLYEHARKTLKWSNRLSDFFEFEKMIQAKNHIWQTSGAFSWCHAARPAYGKMFEKIKEVINDNS